MPSIADHPLRYKLANELHARPFPSMAAPCSVVFIAIKQPNDAVSRERARDYEHLCALLDRHGAPHPQPGATHYYGEIGKHWVKWEQHTEFVTYTVFTEGVSERAFDPAGFEVFPADWLREAPGQRITSVMLHVLPRPERDETIDAHLKEWFVGESLAVSTVIDGSAVMAGDFRIDMNGHLRFAVFASPGTGARRTGRIVQRLCEIETYKAMSMLGFARVRAMQPELNALDSKLTGLMSHMKNEQASAETTLHNLLAISAELETLSAQSSFRLSATGAYEALVNQRIEVLREQRYRGRQLFREFMMRRYAPAMRTVHSAEARMEAMSSRSIRASNLLRTRVDVERSAQNQALLESMDKRSDLQLRLQRTVEGLSVVAISYYAVSLAGYLLYPVADATGIARGWLMAAAVIPVVIVVRAMIKRLRQSIE